MPSNTGDTALENLTKILVANALDMAVSSSWEGHSGLNRAKMAYLIAFRWLPGGAYGFRCHRLEVRLIVSWRVATTPARHLPHGRDLNSVVQHDQKLAGREDNNLATHDKQSLWFCPPKERLSHAAFL